MEDTLEYWQNVLEQHENHLTITEANVIKDDLFRDNCKLAIKEALAKIEELS